MSEGTIGLRATPRRERRPPARWRDRGPPSARRSRGDGDCGKVWSPPEVVFISLGVFLALPGRPVGGRTGMGRGSWRPPRSAGSGARLSRTARRDGRSRTTTSNPVLVVLRTDLTADARGEAETCVRIGHLNRLFDQTALGIWRCGHAVPLAHLDQGASSCRASTACSARITSRLRGMSRAVLSAGPSVQLRRAP